MEDTVAISTNDLKNISKNSFGKSHFFQIYRLSDSGFEMLETRENVLFMQSCELQGRIEHLHGLLGDVKTFIGDHFLKGLREDLEEYGHQLITVQSSKIEAALDESRPKLVAEYTKES